MYRIITDINEIENFGGVVCSTDYYALQVLERFSYSKNIAIAGFDNISLWQNLHLPLLTVQYSTDKIAKQCMRYLLGRPYQRVIEHTLLDYKK